MKLPSITLLLISLLLTSHLSTLHAFFFTSSTPQHNESSFSFRPASLIEGCPNPTRPVPMFLGDVNAKYDGDEDELSSPINNTSPPSPPIETQSLHQPFTPLSPHHGGGGGKRDPNENYEDTAKWSIYPQKSQNAHVVIGVLTGFTLYIWFCNVTGLLQLSKAFLIAGIVQMTQGVYLLTWLFYLLHPQDIVQLREYVMNDAMELQHMAISTCLLVAGVWDFITGWLLHFRLPIYIDSYNRQIIRSGSTTPIKQPNNLLFFQRYVPVIITIAHMLNGINFISHPQHSEENTFGHVALGISMIFGGFCFYWVRVRHKAWKHFTQEVYPTLINEAHMTRSFESTPSRTVGTNGAELNDLTHVDTTINDLNSATYAGQYDPTHAGQGGSGGTTPLSPDAREPVEVWTVGAQYAIEDLQALGASNSHSRYGRRGLNWDRFDIFAFDTAPRQLPARKRTDDEENDDNLEDIDGTRHILESKDVDNYRSAASNQFEWNGSILDVEYRKHLYPHLNVKFKWNSISTHRIVNIAYNSLQFVLHHTWYTKTRRELVASAFAIMSSFNFCFIAWLLMTFIEPPIRLHYTHWFECYSEIYIVYTTIGINYVLSALAGLYLFLTIIHYNGILRLPFLYRIPFLQK